MHPYTQPKLPLSAFNCPHCHAYASQHKSAAVWMDKRQTQTSYKVLDTYYISVCSHCKAPAYWKDDLMIFPNILTTPPPNKDIPEEIKRQFEEARQIANMSPKGAAALLRLVIQNLCIHLGAPGKSIDKDIKYLVENGLPERVQQSLDIVRVIGNESVHPGQIDLNDTPEITATLFSLVNIIADVMITQPKEIKTLYGSLPAEKREAIEKRDQPKT